MAAMTDANNASQFVRRKVHIYIGMFLVAFSTLALEITLVRILSVVAWYHLAGWMLPFTI